MNHIRLNPVSLKSDPRVNEAWVQEVIVSTPEILGLGELRVIDRERRQLAGGRLDMLLQEEDSKRRYEVEIQLGASDPSHIIRALEYWDIERRRFPQYEHTVVLIAEEITGRFLNVISLFNGFIPVMALQMNAFEAPGGGISLVFTRVVDTVQLGTEEESEGTSPPADRAYWDTRATPKTVKIADEILNLCRSFCPEVQPSYNRYYIGMRVGGKACNFAHSKPRKTALLLHIDIPESEETNGALEQAGFDLVDYMKDEKHYRIRLSAGDVQKGEELLRSLLKQAYDLRNGE